MIGGGVTGVELAAEVATTYPDKEVTLVHGGSEVLSEFEHVPGYTL